MLHHHGKEDVAMECFLSRDELLRLDGGRGGLVLRCLRGTVWVTCGDGADYLVSSGRNFELPPRTGAIVEALEPAEFRLGEPAAEGRAVHGATMGVIGC